MFNLGHFISIKPGKFLMGSPVTEKDRFDDETQREVTISKEFEIADAPVTQAQWKEVMGSNPSYFKGDDHPVECVSWEDAQKFIQKLNESQSEYTYRLPTEEEWEYCARAGTTTAYFFGDDPKDLPKYAWFYENSENRTHPVKQKLPNPWGLYDVCGNVWEWCQDWYKR